ncbi:NAD(P)-dependent oxidoreductase, partial [Pseudomonas fluorescens]
MRGLDEANFEDPDTCAAFVTATDADAVINAVAYTAVDKAEEDEALALMVNATTPGAIARAAAARGLPLVHISTDYVFDGEGTAPFAVDHLTGPLGAYGRTKLAGEEAVRTAGGTHAILRTSWVVSSHGNNFVKTMLRLGAEREKLTIV